MKKLNLIIAAIILSVVFISSCKKEHCDKQNNQVINVTINQNTSYTYQLLTANNGKAMGISQQASHSSVSTITTGATPGSLVYSYVPAKDYLGTDAVVLSTQNSQQVGQGCSNHKGNGDHHGHHDNDDDDNSTTTINITVVANLVK